MIFSNKQQVTAKGLSKPQEWTLENGCIYVCYNISHTKNTRSGKKGEEPNNVIDLQIIEESQQISTINYVKNKQQTTIVTTRSHSIFAKAIPLQMIPMAMKKSYQTIDWLFFHYFFNLLCLSSNHSLYFYSCVLFLSHLVLNVL